MGKYEPCKNCQKRYVGCHSSCVDYKKFQESNDQLKKNKRPTPSAALLSARTTHNSLSALRPNKRIK